MTIVLLIAALIVGTADERSIFDEPYQWPRIITCLVLVVLAVVVHLVHFIRGDDDL